MVNLPSAKMGAADGPLLALAVGCKDEGALAGADEDANAAHRFLLCFVRVVTGSAKPAGSLHLGSLRRCMTGSENLTSRLRSGHSIPLHLQSRCFVARSFFGRKDLGREVRRLEQRANLAFTFAEHFEKAR